MRKRTTLLLSLLSLALLPGRSEAIVGVGDLVYDPAIHVESITTALMTTQTVVNQVLDLTPIDELVILEGYTEDMTALGQVVKNLQLLAGDVQQMARLFDRYFGIETLPTTHWRYAVRRSEVGEVIILARRNALCAQNLIMTTLRTINHLLALIHSVRSLIGNLQAETVLIEGQSKLAQLLAEHNVMRAATEMAEAMEAADQASSIESLKLINRDVFRSWPGGN